jgi:hypothetical protein
MKKMFSLIILILVVSSCSKNRKLPNDNKNVAQKLDLKNSEFKETKQLTDSFSIVIKDSSDYSISFIRSLKTDKFFWNYNLNGNLFIFNDNDTTKFPEDPPLGKLVILSNKKEDLEINLTVKRVFQSSIEYKLEFIQNGTSSIQKGLADLSPHFFLGSESDTDDSTGYSYFSAEYWDKNIDYLSIRIGKEPINEKTLRGKIICKIGSLKVDLDNFPTLKEKQ